MVKSFFVSRTTTKKINILTKCNVKTEYKKMVMHKKTKLIFFVSHKNESLFIFWLVIIFLLLCDNKNVSPWHKYKFGVARKIILSCNKKFDVAQKVIWLRQKRVDVAWKSIPCHQKKVDVAQKSISYRQKQDDAASKKYFVRLKVIIFSKMARHIILLTQRLMKWIVKYIKLEAVVRRCSLK